MKTITNDYKTDIALLGKQIDSKITYKIGGVDTVLNVEEINSITPHFSSNILKSAMKQLDIDSNVEISVGTELNYKFGLLVGTSFEYLDFGNYIVYSVEKNEDTNSYSIVCYDKMLYSMKDYEKLDITYPITIRNYINAICSKIGLTFANLTDTFANYDKEIPSELYLTENDDGSYTTMGYTYRDILDELAEVTASTICINNDDELEIRYINNTNDTINEEYLSDTNVTFGEKFGPVNSIVLSRSADSDNVYLQDEESITENGLTEVKISDNQIMNDNNRSEYLIDILAKLDGLEYYLNDYTSPGITYYELCDRYNIQIGDNTYNCIMFNDEIDITQGLKEIVNTEKPEETTTDYTKSDKTDQKINQTYLIVDKVNGEIDAVVSQTIDTTNPNSALSQAQAAKNAVDNLDYVDSNTFENYQTTVSTTYAQKSDGFEYNFDKIVTQISSQVSSGISESNAELHKYIRFVDGVIYLGASDSEVQAVLTNTGLYFVPKGTTSDFEKVAIAYFTNGALQIKDATVFTSIKIGNFAFKPRANGNLTFGKVSD